VEFAYEEYLPPSEVYEELSRGVAAVILRVKLRIRMVIIGQKLYIKCRGGDTLMFKKMIPSLFTFSNLTFGMLSILFSLNGKLKTSAIMLILAAIIDRYDGRIARRFSATTNFGKELDSLADLISFGAAPAILSWVLFLNSYSIIGYFICILFPIAGAYRLARFNVTEFKNVYSGVPITVAGAIMAFINLISLYTKVYPLILSIIMIFLSYLMVSKIQFKKI
jgi:CDP-diacylglycerol--serine O-phosphatidyltransferase